jgi:CubicO group peptidase (beta-lactamase class C family)
MALVSGCNSIGQPKMANKDSLAPAPTVVPALSTSDLNYYRNLMEHHFDSFLLRRGFNGGILIAKNGEVVYEHYLGFRDLRKKDSLTANTPMHIASVSKTFTGMAVLQLIQKGKLQLNDPVSNFFPGFPYPGVTVKTLLNHRSGLPNYIHYMESTGWDKNKPVTNADVLNSLMTAKPGREAAPDRKFSYSNTNYALLALIIEKVTGMSYPEYMKKSIFGPLQMNHTFVATTDSLNITPSFEANGRYWQPDCLDATYGDKNIYTTPEDLLKWDQAVTNEKIIGTALLDSAYMPYSNERRSIHNYGLAWRMLTLPNGKKVIYHNGRWHGSNAAFARLLDEKATIIIIGNRYNSNIYNSARTAYDLFGNYLQGRNGSDDEENIVSTRPARRHKHYTRRAVAYHRKASHSRNRKS